MLDRVVVGERAARSTTSRCAAPSGELRYEECFTRDGFDGPYTILYHLRRPHTQRAGRGRARLAGAGARRRERAARASATIATQELAAAAAGRRSTRACRCCSTTTSSLGVAHPSAPDPVYFANADGDELIFVHEGGGVAAQRRSATSLRGRRLRLRAARACSHRFVPDDGAAGLAVDRAARAASTCPQQWRNEVGQLRMDAPYSHRDFRRPEFARPARRGHPRDLVVKRGGALPRLRATTHSPLDVVGWDGAVYPWAFPILEFQPRVGLGAPAAHVHGTFAARGALICSFVPRPLDFHPEAIPCPYPHARSHCDEVLFYCARQLHLAPRRRPGQHLAPPGRRPARPAPGRLRGADRVRRAPTSSR